MKTAIDVIELWEFNYCQPSGLDDQAMSSLIKALNAFAEERVKAETSMLMESLHLEVLIEDSIRRKAREHALEEAAKAMEYKIGNSLETEFDRLLVESGLNVLRDMASRA